MLFEITLNDGIPVLVRLLYHIPSHRPPNGPLSPTKLQRWILSRRMVYMSPGSGSWITQPMLRTPRYSWSSSSWRRSACYRPSRLGQSILLPRFAFRNGICYRPLPTSSNGESSGAIANSVEICVGPVASLEWWYRARELAGLISRLRSNQISQSCCTEGISMVTKHMRSRVSPVSEDTGEAAKVPEFRSGAPADADNRDDLTGDRQWCRSK
ncbi:hypothetical protein EMPG_12984 [Blastomyces silverae]|uniref:Uncharacterized protein n=1 Tax=Blastomyces silverae TaxID=2060906 RepID=A0A0H1BL68_9EURO|nr:hypothetical protein EMPG_12984 [Blastomyces silverae]